jgi:hypothetical protein
MIFEMTKQQKDKLDQWQDNIEKVHGEKGKFEYTFKANGKGYDISVFCELSKLSLELVGSQD